MWLVLAVAFGGAIGCVLRFILSEHVYAWLGREFPYGILTVNILGSLLMGFLAVLLVNKLDLSQVWRAMVLVGFLGGLTTFSSFSLDTVHLIQQGVWLKALVYIVLSVLLCVSATLLGMFIAQKVC